MKPSVKKNQAEPISSTKDTPGELPESLHLQLGAEEMRRLGYQVIDMLVTHFEDIKDKPVATRASRQDMEEMLRESLPESPNNQMQVLRQLENGVFSTMMHLDHPRFFAWVPSPSNYVSVMGDLLASGFNVFSGLWMTSAGPSQLELITIDWLKELLHYPASGSGLFVSGGSMANLTGLTIAASVKLGGRRDKGVLYCSDQTHSSVEKAVRVLGFHPDQLRKLPADTTLRLSVKDLQEAIKADKKAGKIPFCVIANAGTTNTGTVDPIEEIYMLCQEEGGLWLHVDGAYGAAGMLSQQGQRLLKGLSYADSLSVDPHKWLFQPYEIGCLLVKNPKWLNDTFHILPEYLKDTQPSTEEVDFSNRGIQLTRGFRALKLWMSLKVFGAEAFRKAVTRGIELAEIVQDELSKLPNWQIVTPPQLAVLTFRYLPDQAAASEINRFNKEIVERMIARQYAMIASTELEGQVVIRMCTINPRATREDIHTTVQQLTQVARRLEKSNKWTRSVYSYA
ncbi:aminotransferase class V-fold PLP-dependent enzyme [Rhodocytophaga aerolata]|uniref:Aminotransferase class V-fold PLP-dependent enzyme n=1 Tax=Rhodocytophaga aerolata TaxID=455078 RepID=A0ABT8R955_9BACT|nr:aminotransferase class V-fold PLP-dependent enzyme [Rhodocytophaga aerolata]MDO1447297.1 aminotransferase class V-fold PLP-dependent enzyme [Rhodocytophaga aerolata]